MRWAALVASICLAAATPGQAASGYLDLLQNGIERAEQGQWDLAYRDFAEATRLDPDDALGYVGQALCQLAGRQLDSAAALFRRADLTDRADAAAQLGLGLCYVESGRLATAEGLLKKANGLDPLLYPTYYYRAVIGLTAGRLDEAAELLARARELGAPAALLDYLQAMRLFAAGRWQAAAEGLRKLRPKLALSTPGLPLPLPLAIEGEPGSELKFVIPERDPLTETVAPRAVTAAPLAEPARMGPLTLVSPLAGEVVSGRIPIRIELRQPRSYKYVTISIDGQLKGMTNREPFYVVWDTTQAADGPHEIRAKAFGGTEVEIVVPVTVQNLVSAGRNPYDVAHYRTTSRRLGGLLMHGHPPISVERLMLEAYRQQDPEQALDMYERVLAQDPTRVDLVPPLLALYREQGLALDPRTIPEPHEGIPGARRVALTFDDGPRPEYTTPILDLLRRYEARGTFLVTGRMSEKHPELIKAIAADGHELGNHTYNHLHLDTLSRAEVIYEVLKTKVILDDLTGGTSRLFRPPGGHYNQEVRESIAALGFIPVFWSINGGSYSRLAPAEAAAAIMRRLRDGAILLLHNGGDNTLPLLPYLLAELKEAGYRCVTVSDLLRSPTEAPVLARPSFGPLPPSQLQGYAGDE